MHCHSIHLGYKTDSLLFLPSGQSALYWKSKELKPNHLLTQIKLTPISILLPPCPSHQSSDHTLTIIKIIKLVSTLSVTEMQVTQRYSVFTYLSNSSNTTS